MKQILPKEKRQVLLKLYYDLNRLDAEESHHSLLISNMTYEEAGKNNVAEWDEALRDDRSAIQYSPYSLSDCSIIESLISQHHLYGIKRYRHRDKDCRWRWPERYFHPEIYVWTMTANYAMYDSMCSIKVFELTHPYVYRTSILIGKVWKFIKEDFTKFLQLVPLKAYVIVGLSIIAFSPMGKDIASLLRAIFIRP